MARTATLISSLMRISRKQVIAPRRVNGGWDTKVPRLDIRSSPYGIRTRDLRLERPASWSTRRTGRIYRVMRPVRARGWNYADTPVVESPMVGGEGLEPPTSSMSSWRSSS